MSESNRKTAIIIGAGPAGLTAAYEFVHKSDIHCIVVERSHEVGGLARTVNYKGNRIDIGGHRFFSKSERVMRWWQNILPLERNPGGADARHELAYRSGRASVDVPAEGPDPETDDRVMLVRSRLSRILHLRKFFSYPITLDANTIRNLGVVRAVRIAFSYARAHMRPIAPEASLEDFFINRFGHELYETFFKDYTEKVWGMPCSEIAPEWGAQRIKGLSIGKAILHALRGGEKDLSQRGTETSLVERFLYPKFGPGQMWEEVAAIVQARGVEIVFGHSATRIELEPGQVSRVHVRDESGATRTLEADYVFSTMPVKQLIASMEGDVPAEVREVAQGLIYRDFITVGLLLRKMKQGENGDHANGAGRRIPDNWVYVQESDVKVGRIQVFNNWSPYMVADPSTVWMGLEYFCDAGDELWSLADDDFARLGAAELVKLGMIDLEDVLDSTVIRERNAYPAYFGAHDRFDVIRAFTDRIENLYLIGRNGMHRYNNQDHSMLTAMTAVENILNGTTDKSNIWDVNTEGDYHEEAGES